MGLFLLAIIKICVVSFPYLTSNMYQGSASFSCIVHGNTPQCCLISPSISNTDFDLLHFLAQFIYCEYTQIP